MFFCLEGFSSALSKHGDDFSMAEALDTGVKCLGAACCMVSETDWSGITPAEDYKLPDNNAQTGHMIRG